ncbi:hypothetical protein GmHk_07G018959 [Glycine max]|nr:hypothetical protein GmHk_07G018959 [Glycine max]
MENMKMNKDERFAQKGVPIHSQVMKIRQESEKIVDWSPGKPEIRPVLREISRQISRSPLGISGRPISVAFIFWFDMFYQVDIGRVWGIGFEGSSILNGLVIYLERGLKEDEK